MAHEILKALCEKHPDVKISKQDSLDADNCEEGTRSFINEYFPRRRVVRVKEFVGFIDKSRHVRRVLIYKLRGLSNENETALEDN